MEIDIKAAYNDLENIKLLFNEYTTMLGVLCTGGSFSAAMGFPPQFPHFFCHADASVYAYSLRHCVFKSHYTCFYKKNQVLLKIFS